MLQQGLYNLLTVTPAITTIIGARANGDKGIHSGAFSAKEPVYPAIVYREIHGDGVMSMDGPDELQFSRMQFSCYAKGYGQAKQLAKAVRKTFENFTGVLSDGTVVDNMKRISEMDIFEEAPGVHCVPVDFEIAYHDIGS